MNNNENGDNNNDDDVCYEIDMCPTEVIKWTFYIITYKYDLRSWIHVTVLRGIIRAR